MGSSPESLGTKITGVTLNTSMSFLMHFQTMFGLARVVANTALEWFVFRVSNLDMFDQQVPVRKGLGA